MNKVLTYTGNGAFFEGIPARDLTQADVDALPATFTKDALIASGLYMNTSGVEEAAVPAPTPSPKSKKAPKGDQ